MMCPIHEVEMKKHEKEGETWWSHKLDDGTWCNGKQKKAQSKPVGSISKLDVLKMVAPYSDGLDEAMSNAEMVLTWLNK